MLILGLFSGKFYLISGAGEPIGYSALIILAEDGGWIDLEIADGFPDNADLHFLLASGRAYAEFRSEMVGFHIFYLSGEELREYVLRFPP